MVLNLQEFANQTNMAQELLPNRSDNRGGHPNCGRKKGTKKPFQIRCEPDNIEKIRCWIKENNL